MRFASVTSSAALSSGTRPISLRYMRTGSDDVPVERPSLRVGRSMRNVALAQHRLDAPCSPFPVDGAGSSITSASSRCQRIVVRLFDRDAGERERGDKA